METDLWKMQSELARIAMEISVRLDRLQTVRIVFAESCTAGLIAATMGGVPGISRFLCGSAVTYREATKTEWLGLSPDTIAEHTAESAQVSEDLAVLVLQRTPEATLSLAITGHLGPGVAKAIDGLIFIGVVQRNPDGFELLDGRNFRLKSIGRVERQTEAALLALKCLNLNLEQDGNWQKNPSKPD